MLEIIDSTMPVSKQEIQRQALLQLWNNGIRNAKEIHARTDIPLTTIYDNIENWDSKTCRGARKISAHASRGTRTI